MKSKISPLILSLVLIVSAVGVTHAQSPALSAACYQPARLWVGGTGRVTTTPNLPNRIRSAASYQARVLGYIPAGSAFTVVGGPYCVSGVQWWQVNYNGVVGWTIEGNGSVYYLEPNTFLPPSCALPTRLTIGGVARVTPGDPNVLRSAPGTRSTGANSVVIGSIPGGGAFTVNGGPVCGSDGRWWWYVNYNGQVGWTAEGDGASYTYWLEPWSNGATTCPNFLPSRLTVGNWGRVSTYPYLPNNIRSAATYSGTVIGQIPAGNAFSVLSGPVCAENTAWWQVNYNSVVGWTVEGSGSTYWLEPY